MKICPCLSDKTYQDCCGPYLDNTALVANAEALMRSRYTAFCLKNVDYIQATVAKRAAENFDLEGIKDFVNTMRFQGLEILRSQQPFQNRAYIEFLVHCEDKTGHHYHLQELSEFECIEGQWFYVDGRQQVERHEHHNGHHHPNQPYRQETKVGRNDPCPCLSGKKFKKCCGS